MAIGEGGEADVGPGDRDDDTGQEPVQPRHMRVGVHHLRKGDQHSTCRHRQDEGERERVPHDADVRLVGGGQRLREATLQAERCDERGEFDHHHGEREAADEVRTVEPARDEQERDARGEAQDEACDIGAAALGERIDVLGFGHR